MSSEHSEILLDLRDCSARTEVMLASVREDVTDIKNVIWRGNGEKPLLQRVADLEGSASRRDRRKNTMATGRITAIAAIVASMISLGAKWALSHVSF